MKRYKLLNIIAVLLLVSTLSAQAQEIKVSSGRTYTDGNMESRQVSVLEELLHCLYLKKFVK